jgi:hypothetical protein
MMRQFRNVVNHAIPDSLRVQHGLLGLRAQGKAVQPLTVLQVGELRIDDGDAPSIEMGPRSLSIARFMRPV